MKITINKTEIDLKNREQVRDAIILLKRVVAVLTKEWQKIEL